MSRKAKISGISTWLSSVMSRSIPMRIKDCSIPDRMITWTSEISALRRTWMRLKIITAISLIIV